MGAEHLNRWIPTHPSIQNSPPNPRNPSPSLSLSRSSSSLHSTRRGGGAQNNPTTARSGAVEAGSLAGPRVHPSLRAAPSTLPRRVAPPPDEHHHARTSPGDAAQVDPSGGRRWPPDSVVLPHGSNQPTNQREQPPLLYTLSPPPPQTNRIQPPNQSILQRQ
jgi:hypothetical protein